MIDTHGKWLRLNSLMMLTTDNAIFWLPAGECIYGRMYAFIQRYTHGSRTTCPCGAHSGSPRLHFYARLTQIIVFQEIISSFPPSSQKALGYKNDHPCLSLELDSTQAEDRKIEQALQDIAQHLACSEQGGSRDVQSKQQQSGQLQEMSDPT